MPVRRAATGTLEVLLVTSRETRRWVIPKGWPWPDRSDHRAAAEEAREEAGVRGKARKAAIGGYDYEKRLKHGSRPVHVDVYLLMVARELDKWPEDTERTRAWFAPNDAATAVDEPELKVLLRRLPEIVNPILEKLETDKAKKAARKAARKAKRDKPSKKSKTRKRKAGGKTQADAGQSSLPNSD